LKCLDGRVLDELRGIDFGLASGEGVNFFALGDHGFGLSGDSERQRGRDLGDTG
jgi:hypothetical protein